jgi:hypothetical protein
VPSLEPLHLHLISHDLSGGSLSKRDHYTSFATTFFVPISKVISLLENPLGNTQDALRALVSDAKAAKLQSFPSCHLCKKYPTPTAEKSREAWGKFASQHLATCALTHTHPTRK